MNLMRKRFRIDSAEVVEKFERTKLSLWDINNSADALD